MPDNPLRSPEQYDVVVIGAGPAGASTGALLAKQGHRVLLLEREKFPRYHIGESLITGVLKVIDQLDLRVRLESAGFVKKYGGSLVWGKQKQRWTFEFIEGGPYSYSYQVRRADYDALLLTRARELGAMVLEETVVKDVVYDGERVAGVRYAMRGGDLTEARARLVVDASGQARVVGRKLSEVDWQEDLRNVAIWNYFQDCDPLRGSESGNILIENVPDGWFWAIPLHDGTTSIGYVTSADAAAATGLDLPRLFAAKVAETEALQRMTAGAQVVGGFRSARDWSYHCTRMHGAGWVLVGDAAAFVDPLFSTGVALASLAADALAKTIDLALRKPALEQQALTRYEQCYREFLGDVLAFVRFFYDGSRDREAYYQRAQGIIDPERVLPARTDFVALISGLSCAKPIFDLDLDGLAHPVAVV